jgi:hypothetical protein
MGLIRAGSYDTRRTAPGKTANLLRKRVERVKGIEPSFLLEQAKSSKTGAKTRDFVSHWVQA